MLRSDLGLAGEGFTAVASRVGSWVLGSVGPVAAPGLPEHRLSSLLSTGLAATPALAWSVVCDGGGLGVEHGCPGEKHRA